MSLAVSSSITALHGGETVSANSLSLVLILMGEIGLTLPLKHVFLSEVHEEAARTNLAITYHRKY